MDINARRNWIDGVGFGDCVELTIDGDGRTEDYETLGFKAEWGAFHDIEGFDPENKEIIEAVDSVLAEIAEVFRKEITEKFGKMEDA